MGENIKKIVLTGGPCAGKTTAIEQIKEVLIKKGYRVFIVPESATELINGELRPFGNDSIDIDLFQKLIMKYQLVKEKIYEEAARSLPNDSKSVIIYDRGLLDNKAYISHYQFQKILNEGDLLERYDMVIHLVTAAIGKEEYYT